MPRLASRVATFSGVSMQLSKPRCSAALSRLLPMKVSLLSLCSPSRHGVVNPPMLSMCTACGARRARHGLRPTPPTPSARAW